MLRPVRMRWLNKAVLAAVLLGASIGAPATAEARRTRELTYRYEQVWSSVVRLLRVDYDFPIQDRDEQNGYVLFDYREQGRTYQGSLELLRYEDRGTQRVRVVVTIPQMPTYVEQMMLDQLERKLRADFGVPVTRPEAPSQPPSAIPPNAPRPGVTPPPSEAPPPSEGEASSDDESSGAPETQRRRRR